MILDYIEFKRRLGLYCRFSKQMKKWKRKMEDYEDEMTCIPSLFPETTLVNGELVAIPKSHGDPRNQERRKLELSDKSKECEVIYLRYKKKVDELDNILNSFDENFRKLLMRVYVYREGIENVAQEIGYSKSGLAYYIDKNLENYFKKFNSVPYGEKPM